MDIMVAPLEKAGSPRLGNTSSTPDQLPICTETPHIREGRWEVQMWQRRRVSIQAS